MGIADCFGRRKKLFSELGRWLELEYSFAAGAFTRNAWYVPNSFFFASSSSSHARENKSLVQYRHDCTDVVPYWCTSPAARRITANHVD